MMIKLVRFCFFPLLVLQFISIIALSLFFSILVFPLIWLRFFKIDIDVWITYIWGRLATASYLMKRKRIGRPSELGVYVAPHSSFWDILILGSELAGFFVSKAEVVKWPAIGLAAKMTRTIFINREKGTKALKVILNSAKKLFKQNKSVILFPEGTRSYEHIKRFKKGAFYVSFNTGKPIIPVILNYYPKDAMIFKKKRDFISELFLQSLVFKKYVRIEYLDPIYPDKFSSIDELRDYTHELMSKKYNAIEASINI